MPAVLPTHWTSDEARPRLPSPLANDARWQAISFFTMCFFLSAWGVRWMWNTLGREFAWLPRIGYARALSLVVLWGLLFVIVLTMISGARELMTPGAWRKQGWTYHLAEGPHPNFSSIELRRRAMEELRTALSHYAATHDGRFPTPDDPSIDPAVWTIPGWGELRYLYVPDQAAQPEGRLLAFEPELYGEDRVVLLTNGFLGSMRTSDIEALWEAAKR